MAIHCAPAESLLLLASITLHHALGVSGMTIAPGNAFVRNPTPVTLGL